MPEGYVFLVTGLNSFGNTEVTRTISDERLIDFPRQRNYSFTSRSSVPRMRSVLGCLTSSEVPVRKRDYSEVQDTSI